MVVNEQGKPNFKSLTSYKDEIFCPWCGSNQYLTYQELKEGSFMRTCRDCGWTFTDITKITHSSNAGKPYFRHTTKPIV
jgi:hypothetical protein